MKTVIIIGDGMSDYPVESLGGKTPLQVARKPNIDRIAREGRMGLLETLPEGLPLGSAVANLSVLGYDPAETFHGRAVLEAANMGVALDETDVALRMNLICIEEGRIKNHSAGHISNAEATEIVRTLRVELGDDSGEIAVAMHTGVSYRHLLVLRGTIASPDVQCIPPHDHVGECADDLLPTATSEAGKASEAKLRSLMSSAAAILSEHPVNRQRCAQAKDPANAIWPWSPGRVPQMQTMQGRFGIRGAVISAVDLINGLGVYAGMDVISVDGATGLWDTNYEGKAEACLEALRDHDLVYLHVEATDEAGHSKDAALKVECIEMLDERLVGPIMAGVSKFEEGVCLAILPDHPTPVASGIHARDAVPVAIWRPDVAADKTTHYDEGQATQGEIPFMRGDDFIKLVLGVDDHRAHRRDTDAV